MKKFCLTITTSILISTFFYTTAFGFVPGGVKSYLTGGKTHIKITESALDVFYGEYGFGQGAQPGLTKPMKTARDKITQANADVDENHAHESVWHCDAENLQGCSDNIKKLLDDAVSKLQADDAPNARTSLGQALHSLQDFYAHKYL